MPPPKDPYKFFRIEAHELVDQFASAIVALEKGGNNVDVIQQLLRYAHTLKGAARVVKQPEIANQAHAIEDVLAPFRDQADSVPRGSIDAILKHVDDIRSLLVALTPIERKEAGPAPVVTDEALRTIRADIGEMDALLEGVSETYAQLTGLRTAARTVTQAQHLAELLSASLAPRNASDAAPLSGAALNRAYFMAEELGKNFSGLDRNLASAIDQMDRELRQLRDTAEQMRLVSAGVLFTPLERTANDAARALGTQVTVVCKGGNIRLDADVLERIRGALVQLVRNAVAHGIESEDARRTKGKTATGRISINVFRSGAQVIFECQDDGRGVDIDAVQRIAVERGMTNAEVKRLDTSDLFRLLMRGGISTTKIVTEVSGRGIGLDVVREAVEYLKGEITVQSETGKGTTFKLTVPLSLSSMEALNVEAAGSTVAVPLDAVRNSIRITGAQISGTSEGMSVIYEGEAIPFIPLSQTLHGNRTAVARNWSVIVLAGAEGLAAVGVDRLLGTSRLVVRPLPQYTPGNPVVAGASLNAEGNPLLVLDPNGLVAAARSGNDAADLGAIVSALPILVIDDSLTTRMLEQSILESAGYDVDTAESAEEGLESARRKRYALILVDVEMPGMDGFTFVECIRADAALRDIPAILVTSRNAAEDFQRGRDAGANGYIVKGEFDQNNLLTMIKTLTG